MASGGDWLLLYELLERGDPEFVDRLRAVDDAEEAGALSPIIAVLRLPDCTSGPSSTGSVKNIRTITRT